MAAAWYRARSAGATRNGRSPSDTARRSTDGGPSTAHHEPGSRRRPISGDGNDWSGCSVPTSTSGRAACTLSSSSTGHAPERWITSAPGRKEEASAAAVSAMAASGVATITRSASRPASTTSATRDAPSRWAAARVDGEEGLRPATASAAQPRATERDGDGRPGATGAHEGERPLRSTLHVHLCVSSPLRSGPGAGAGLLGRRQS